MRKTLTTLTFLLIVSFSAKASMMISLNIEQLTRIAAHIIKGEVIDIQNTPEGNRVMAYVTVKIEERLKGEDTGKTFIFNQPVESLEQNPKNTFVFPEYEVGKTYLFFLPKNGGPIGLQQGVFKVEKDTLVNFESRKRHLFRNLKTSENSETQTLLNQNKNPESKDDSVKNFMRLIKSLQTSQNKS